MVSNLFGVKLVAIEETRINYVRLCCVTGSGYFKENDTNGDINNSIILLYLSFSLSVL